MQKKFITFLQDMSFYKLCMHEKNKYWEINVKDLVFNLIYFT